MGAALKGQKTMCVCVSLYIVKDRNGGEEEAGRQAQGGMGGGEGWHGPQVEPFRASLCFHGAPHSALLSGRSVFDMQLEIVVAPTVGSPCEVT